MTFKDRLAAAIGNTPAHYLNSIFAQRHPGPEQTGSWYEPGQVGLQDLLEASWVPFTHPNLWPGARGFKARLPGFVGVVRLEDYPLAHVIFTDRKGTLGTEGGGVTPEFIPEAGQAAAMPYSDFTTLILMDEDGKEQVATWFPGEPTPLPTVMSDASLLGKRMTTTDALELGFVWMKVVRSW